MYAHDKVHQSVAHVFQAIRKPAPTLQLSSMLPHIQLELSDDDDHKSAALPHLKLEGTYDMCASGTFRYRPYHEAIQQHYPHVVESFTDFSSSGFCMVNIRGISKEDDGIDLTAKIRYKTPYVLDDGLPGILEVALSDDIAVNTVFRLPLQ